MRSIFVLFCCSAVIAGLMWMLDPGVLEKPLLPLAVLPGNPKPAPISIQKTEPPLRRAAIKSAGIRPADAPANTEVMSIPDTEQPALASVAPVTEKPASRPSPRQAVVSVSAETAALYSTNLPEANVIRVLKNGDVVEPQFKFISEGQERTFVRVSDTAVSGFLQSENLGTERK